MNKLLVASTKASAILLLLLASSHSLASSDCENLKGCEKKSCEIQRQLTIANEAGNERKIDGLTTALKENAENCTYKGLKNDLVEEIEESWEDIAEYKADLQQAEKDGKSEKILKYQAKIAEEESEIMRLEKELSDLD
jgi:hypothetical protein